jgi:hypothetical protein
MKLKPWSIALLGIFLLGGVFSLRLLGDADLGFHLRGGKQVIEDHQVPRVDTYTYTRAGAPYIDLHWGYQALLYLTYKVGDYPALSVLNFLLLMAVLILTYQRLKLAGAPLFMAVPLLFLFLIASEIRFQVRPEVLSFLLMSATLRVLETRVKDGTGPLWLLPLLHLLWVNTEGLFPIGWFLMGAYVFTGALKRQENGSPPSPYPLPQGERGNAKSSTGGREVGKAVPDPSPSTGLRQGYARLAGEGRVRALISDPVYIFGLSVAICLLNPFFLQGFLHPFQLLATLGTSNVLKGTIVEFQPPWKLLDMGPFGPGWAIGAYLLYAGIVLVLVGATLRRRGMHEILITAAFLYLSLRANRNIPLFFLATLPLAVRCWKGIDGACVRGFHERFLSRPVVAWLLLALALGVGARAATNAYYIDQGRTIRTGIGLDREGHPVEVVEFLTRNRLEGRVLNEMNLGGWLGWALPQPIFVDGRLEVMGEEFYAKQLAGRTQPGGLAGLLAEYRPDIILMMGIDTPHWILDLKGMPDWRLAFVSGSGIAYLRNGYAPQVAALEGEAFLGARGVGRPTREEALECLKAPGPGSFRHVLEGFLLPQDYPRGAMRMAMFFHTLGDAKTAESLYLDRLKAAQGKYYDQYMNLGSLYFQEGRVEEARLCMEQVLKADRSVVEAKGILRALSSR